MKRYVRSKRVAQVHEQVQHLRLDRDVERRHRFVAHQELGLDGQRARDADACALAARELVRVAAREARIEPDPLQQLRDVVGGPRRPRRGRARAAPRRRCRSRACADSATQTGPGRSSGSDGAPPASVVIG